MGRLFRAVYPCIDLVAFEPTDDTPMHSRYGVPSLYKALSMNTPKPAAKANSPTKSDPLLETLRSSFAVFRDTLPLAIGIHKAILLRLPEIELSALKTSLRRYTASTRYLKALATNSVRFDLDGNPDGDVTAEQQQQAADLIKERFRKGAERKREETQAKAREAEAKRHEQERQEKLLKLTQKFSRH